MNVLGSKKCVSLALCFTIGGIAFDLFSQFDDLCFGGGVRYTRSLFLFRLAMFVSISKTSKPLFTVRRLEN